MWLSHCSRTGPRVQNREHAGVETGIPLLENQAGSALKIAPYFLYSQTEQVAPVAV
jgi:hypothetical protein